jgi:hypothetical protein
MQMKFLTIILKFALLTNLHGQTDPKLELILQKDFSENSTNDGKWIFYSDKAYIEKIDKPLAKSVIPNYDFYKVVMTNFLGYHINQGICLVLVDSSKSKTILVEPLWYGGISKDFVKLFIKHKFDNKDSLISFMTQLNDLMQIGSGYKFKQTSYTDTLITYDLGYFKGDSYTTGGSGTSSAINYNKDAVWRNIKVELKNNAIIRYTEINPKTSDKDVIK